MAQIRIISQGSPTDTHVFLVDDDGKEHEIPNIYSIGLQADAKNGMTARLSLCNLDVDIEAKLQAVVVVKEDPADPLDI